MWHPCPGSHGPLIKCILEERWTGVVWLTCLLISKIMWAFHWRCRCCWGARAFLLQITGLERCLPLMVGLEHAVGGPGTWWDNMRATSASEPPHDQFPWHVWSQTHSWIQPFHQTDRVFILGTALGVDAGHDHQGTPPNPVGGHLLAAAAPAPERSDSQASSMQTLDLIFVLVPGRLHLAGYRLGSTAGHRNIRVPAGHFDQRWPGVIWGLFGCTHCGC